MIKGIRWEARAEAKANQLRLESWEVYCQRFEFKLHEVNQNFLNEFALNLIPMRFPQIASANLGLLDVRSMVLALIKILFAKFWNSNKYFNLFKRITAINAYPST